MSANIAVIGLVGNTVFMGVPRFHNGGETIHASDLHTEFGGKGFNQAVAAARQCASVSFLGAAGEDDARSISDFLAGEGIDGMIAAKSVPSAHAAILTDGSGETRVTVFPGAALEVRDVEGFASRIAAADILILNNEVPEDVNLAAAEIARRSGTRVAVNPAPARPLPEALRSGAFLFTPNEFEEDMMGDVAGEVVTTLGARGCRIRSTGEIVPAVPCAAPVDSTGAGDVFTAVLCVRLAEGDDMRSACAAANAAASRSVAVRYVLPSIPKSCMDARKCMRQLQGDSGSEKSLHRPGKVYMVSGMDTGIGKTVVTGLAARSLAARGIDVITVKMVQTGNDGFSEDLDAHRALAGRGRFPEDEAGLTAPQIFKFPSSPLLAAELEGRTVDLGKIAEAVRICSRSHAVTLVESAGGLDVPLTRDVLTADFAAGQGWPVILVTCGRLGAINHALLSLDAAKMRGIKVAGVVHNTNFSDDPRLDADAQGAILRHLGRLGYPQTLVAIPRIDAAAAPDIDFSEIFA